MSNSEQQVLNQLGQFLKELKFEEAEKLLTTAFHPPQYIRVLHNVTEQKTGLISYTFVNYLIQKYQNAFWHKVAACIAAESLDKVVLGHSAGLFHILQAIRLDPQDWMLKDYALSFYKDGILEKSLAKQFAQEVLKFEPKNQQALKISNA
jgi:hypothetical protein